jgi:hypothetical protein
MADIESEEAVTAVAKAEKNIKKKSKKINREKQWKDFKALQSPLCFFHVC